MKFSKVEHPQSTAVLYNMYIRFLTSSRR